ncbi:MAG: SurA N-terminal domain-containing protein [Pseudomonadota bacterium]
MTMQIKRSFATPRYLLVLLFALAGLALGAAPANAQNPFSPAVIVNDSVITYYEIDQRAQFLELVRAPGDLQEQALEDLIDERLQVQEARRLGVVASPEDIADGLTEFAGRADLTSDEFMETMQNDGVDPETVRDFVANGVSWRNVVQEQFRGRVRISPEAVDEAVALRTSRDNVRIRLAEIIVPLTPQNVETLRVDIAVLAEDLDGDIEQFSEAAARFSAAPSRENGGLTDWRTLNELPPALREEFITLLPGQTAGPLALGSAIAIFQLRGLQETGLPAPQIASIDYATINLPPDPAARDALRREVDVCDDLFGQRPGGFERFDLPLNDIPRDIALTLAALDPNEMSFDLADAAGNTRAVMLCGRTMLDEEELREQVRRQLFQETLTSYGDGLLEELRAAAFITFDE